jgi:hypothetical protein
MIRAMEDKSREQLALGSLGKNNLMTTQGDGYKILTHI